VAKSNTVPANKVEVKSKSSKSGAKAQHKKTSVRSHLPASASMRERKETLAASCKLQNANSRARRRKNSLAAASRKIAAAAYSEEAPPVRTAYSEESED
jgi:hypothetical protein